MNTDWMVFMDAVQLCAHDDSIWSPMFAQYSSYFVHNLIQAGLWLNMITLQNSDNLQIGQCILNALPLIDRITI